MALATCPECRRILDIPGKPQSYKCADGRCAKCNETSPMDIPQNVQAAVQASQVSIEKSEPFYIGKVESGIALAPINYNKLKKRKKQAPRESKYPFSQMKVNDSFFVREEDKDALKKLSTAISAACSKRKRDCPKEAYALRTLPGGVRVWRIK